MGHGPLGHPARGGSRFRLCARPPAGPCSCSTISRTADFSSPWMRTARLRRLGELPARPGHERELRPAQGAVRDGRVREARRARARRPARADSSVPAACRPAGSPTGPTAWRAGVRFSPRLRPSARRSSWTCVTLAEWDRRPVRARRRRDLQRTPGRLLLGRAAPRPARAVAGSGRADHAGARPVPGRAGGRRVGWAAAAVDRTRRWRSPTGLGVSRARGPRVQAAGGRRAARSTTPTTTDAAVRAGGGAARRVAWPLTTPERRFHRSSAPGGPGGSCRAPREPLHVARLLYCACAL